MNRRPLVFIAGPLGGAARCEASGQFRNVRNACDMGETIYHQGGEPFVPHLYWAWASYFCPDMTRRDWIDLGERMLARSDALVRLPGESPGADHEVSIAQERGMPIFMASNAVLVPATFPAWVQEWRETCR